MSEAEDLLNSLSSGDATTYTADAGIEEHIIIDKDRNINVPKSLQRIAVQFDHNIETVTFDCPRYWDDNDLSEMYVYINYLRSDKVKGRYLAKNVRVSDEDENVIHFDWTIGNEISIQNGKLIFLVCALKTNTDGVEEIHWNSEINTEMTISDGLECNDYIMEEYPDIINDLLYRMDSLIAADTPILDSSLSQPGFAADAEAAGKILRDIDNKISTIISGADYSHTEGNSIYLKDCGNNKCNITVKGDAVQDITDDNIPSPNNPVEVLSVTGETKVVINNKNLYNDKVENLNGYNVTFDSNEDGSINIVGTPTETYIRLVNNKKIFLAKGTELTINWGKTKEMFRDTTSNPFVWLYSKNGEVVGALGKSAVSSILSDDAYTMTYGFENMVIDQKINETVYCQMELGSLNTDYVEPQLKEYPINLGDIKLFNIAGYEDYIYKNEEDSKWYKKKHIGIKNLQASGTSAVGANNTDFARFYYSVSDRKIINNNQNIQILSDKFTAMTTYDYGLDDYVDIQAIAANRDNLAVFFRIKKETIGGDTKELCNTYLAENPIEIYYVLETPVDEEIVDETLLAQLEKLSEAKTYSGENLIALVCDNKVKGNLNLEYRKFAVCSYGDLEEVKDDYKDLKVEILKTVFPIGATYITQEEINPSEILGFGSWERLNGKVVVGLDENDSYFNEIGKTGGSTTHTLSKEEIPNYDLTVNDPGHTHDIPSSSEAGGSIRGTTGQNDQIKTYFGAVKSNKTGITVNSGGSGQEMNIMNPYEVSGYMWIRRA